jgi:indole-3-glycerol phosphate synthase/phosphoribosylanthranilate isomerase
MPETFLERIVMATRADLAARQAATPPRALRARIADVPPPRDFAAALRPPDAGSARLIAEIKRASPSKGVIAERFNPIAQARAYEAGGAAAISVLTEPRFFLGSLDHLRAVRAAVRLPILRKDFILDPYQVYEARLAGADAILLICSLLDDTQLHGLLALARSLGMEALIEAHDAEETKRAVAAGAHVIGVNARDLRTFAVDPAIVLRLRPLVPSDRLFIAESGISNAMEAARACAFGADAILVGESLMRAADPAALACALATAPGGPIASFFARTNRPFVKICGLTAPDQVRLVTRLGADAFGLIFAPVAPSHRRVTVAQARCLVTALPSSPLPGSGKISEGEAQPAQAGYVAQPSGAASSAGPLPIGVFVDEQPRTIADIAAEVGLGALQLSGDETPEHCADLAERTRLPILKALRPRSPHDLSLVDAYATAGAVILLDTHREGTYGGTGETGDWPLAREAAARWPIILAGGLTPANVASAVATVAPRGVDVSSGVESNLAKDPTKIAAFIAAARQ